MDTLTSFDWVGLGFRLLAAVVILIITAVLASVVRTAVAKLAGKVKALHRPGVDGASLGRSIGSIASLLVWLLGLIVVLGIFQLDGVLSPVTAMLGTVLTYLPSVIGAGVVFVIGLMIAKIVRSLIVTGLGAVDLRALLGRASAGAQKVTGSEGTPFAPNPDAPWEQTIPQSGPGQTAPAQAAPAQDGPKLPEILGNVAFGLIMIVVAIASLQILGIESISRPAELMLTTLLAAIPNIVAALILLGIGVLIARFVTDLLKQVLQGAGLDVNLRKLDLLPAEKSALPTITRIVEIAIVLFFAVMAAQVLGFPQITALLSRILELGGSIVFGAAIIAAGFFIATILAKLLSGQAAVIVKWVTIVLFVAIGLKSMGVADSIIEMAFGALVIGAAAAAVLAFGLGGRDAAARILSRVERSVPADGSQPGHRSSGPEAPVRPGDPSDI
ncbi:mechanosensitive ion channel [Brachybacterium hainanense]|uniref:Mechanosensitive ion channel n=1 Tax=Brachybacterium hainanense TaxID=1541174 RepID=A0ABV6RHP7_9MICO